MRKKILTTLALLLMAISGAWADSYLYLDDISGTSATLKYGVVPDGKPYYPCYDGSNPQWGNQTDEYTDFVSAEGTTIDVDVSCKDFAGASLKSMFFNFQHLTAINNLGNLNTASVTDMESMFYLCSSLTTLDLSGRNTANVNNMSLMFSGCSSLITLDLSGWKTASVTDMRNMFSGCESLTTIYV